MILILNPVNYPFQYIYFYCNDYFLQNSSVLVHRWCINYLGQINNELNVFEIINKAKFHFLNLYFSQYFRVKQNNKT